MDVHLAPGQPARLTQVEDLRRFSVIVAGTAAALPVLQQEQRGVAEFEGGDHGWIAVDWLIAASGRAEDAAWRKDFAAMLAYAESKGWTRADPPAIRGHIVWAPA